jgi:acyl carrier protein
MEAQPDFICVQSSLSATLGGIGLGAYAAANAQLDRLVIERNRRDNTRWLSINWDRVESVDPEPSAPRFGGDNEPALSADEAWTITTQAITQNLSGILVTSPTSLPDRLDHWVENRAHSSTEKQPTGTSEHSRPNLPNDYLAPRTKVEKTIITIWEEFLGMQGIGVEDNFFALGGHSLLAIQIIARLRETFPLEIELRHLVSDNPTPASMAAILEADLPDEEQLEDISSILEEIQELSPEETLAQLNKRSKS